MTLVIFCLNVATVKRERDWTMLQGVKVTIGCILALSCAVAQSDAVFSDTGYAADAYGAADHYPVPAPGQARTQRQFVGYYSHFDEVQLIRLPGPVLRPHSKPPHTNSP
jgi:hypothetical protein